MDHSSNTQLRLIEDLEHKLRTHLPEEYRQHLLEYNVVTPCPDTFKLPNTGLRFQLFSFLGITKVVNDSIWHTMKMLGDALPASTIPIASLLDGGFICLGIGGDKTGKIFYLGDVAADDRGEAETPESAIEIAASFEEFMALFDQPGEIDELDRDGLSLLHRAAGKGDAAEIEKLLGYGANIDLPTDPGGYTSLFVAASEGKHEAVRVLLEAGADTSIACGTSRGTAFQVACALGHREVVEVFLEVDDTLANLAPNNSSPLYIAAEAGNKEIVNLLLQRGAQPDFRPTPTSATPLYIATYKGHRDVVELLLQAGANAAIEFKQATPLQVASLKEDTAMVELLLRSEANPGRR